MSQNYKRLSDDELKTKLTATQYQVTQNSSTEPPFQNEYWDNNEEGIYVDVATGEPLFSSTDKFDSSCGWPSFTKPLNEKLIQEKQDRSYGVIRTEVVSTLGQSHLGHVFDDGPQGLPRYCINSASMKFIPKDRLEEDGYGEYLKLFSTSV